MRARLIVPIAAIALIASCEKNEPAPAAPAKTVAVSQQPQISKGLQTPESVFYDADQDVYFISNVNGQPLAADNNGYISKVEPDTLKTEAKWIEAGKNGVTLT